MSTKTDELMRLYDGNPTYFHRIQAGIAIDAYCADCRAANRQHDSLYLRTMIEEAAKLYAACTTAQQAYETLASIALDTFNADVSSRKQAGRL